MNALVKGSSEGKGVRYTGISVLVSSLCQIIVTIYLANIASAEIIGSIAICIIFYGVLESFSEVGFSGGIIQRSVISNTASRSIFIYSSVLALIISILMVTGYFVLFNDDSLIGLLCLMLLINQIGGISKTLLKKNQLFGVLAKCEIAHNALYLFLFILGSWFIDDFVLLYVITRLFSLFCYNVLLYFAGKAFYRYQLSGPKSFKIAYWYMRFGTYQFLSMTLNMLGRNLDQLLILKFAGKEALGIYKVICDLLVLPTSKLNSIFNNVYHPILASLYEASAFKDKLVLLIKNTSFLTLPILFGIYTLKDILPNTILSHEWNDAAYMFTALLVVAVMRAIGNPLGVMILALGKVQLGFNWNVMALITQILICSILGGLYKGDGVIIGIAISSVLLHFCTYIVLIKPSLKLSSFEYFSLPLNTLFCCAIMTYVGFYLQDSLDVNAWGMLIIQTFTGIVTYILASMVFNYNTMKNVIFLFK